MGFEKRKIYLSVKLERL